MSNDVHSVWGSHNMITCPCNVDPLTPRFYISKTGVCRGIHYFLILALKHRLWVLVRTVDSVPEIKVLSKYKKNIKTISTENVMFYSSKITV